jgi:hypothetical protein
MLNNKTISFPFGHSDMQEVRSYDANSPVRVQYIGRAQPGVATSVAQWQIRKYIYDSTTANTLTIQFAGGTNDYMYEWDERATLSYS